MSEPRKPYEEPTIEVVGYDSEEEFQAAVAAWNIKQGLNADGSLKPGAEIDPPAWMMIGRETSSDDE